MKPNNDSKPVVATEAQVQEAIEKIIEDFKEDLIALGNE